MKYLLNGVAIAAALAFVAPAWAQPAAAPAAPAAPAKAAPAPAKPMGAMGDMSMKKPMMKKHRHMAKKMGGDAMTEQLNQQELARITGGGAPMAPAPAPAPAFGSMPPSGQGQQPGK
jgi:hypothetical protein